MHPEITQFENIVDDDVSIAGTKQLKWMDYCAWMLHLSSFFWLLATSIPYILLLVLLISRSTFQFYTMCCTILDRVLVSY